MLTCSRHTSRVAVDVAWDIGGPGVYVECFYLAYNGDGVHSFFMVENMPLSQYNRDRELLADMVEITFEEACALYTRPISRTSSTDPPGIRQVSVPEIPEPWTVVNS